MSKANERATMPVGTNTVLDRRTVENANRNLLTLVQPGQRVLDVGCGSGTITKGISELLKNEGCVIGIDPSQHLIQLATNRFSSVANLQFEVADINTYLPTEKFDVITSARTLQWLANVKEVLEKMVGMLKTGGCLTILDYNHEKIHWSPSIPESMQQLYDAFLQWRKDAGMDNAIADHLAELLTDVGLVNISVTDHTELIGKNAADFANEIGLWVKVAETRGKQLVQDQYITEELRLKAIAEYSQWIETEAQSLKMYQLAVTGYKKPTI
ncbi:MAG: methyltransferase domain-containing protein [Bacteroidota bacterium]